MSEPVAVGALAPGALFTTSPPNIIARWRRLADDGGEGVPYVVPGEPGKVYRIDAGHKVTPIREP